MEKVVVPDFQVDWWEETWWVEFELSYSCPCCGNGWVTFARVRRDDTCPRCGTVSKYVSVGG